MNGFVTSMQRHRQIRRNVTEFLAFAFAVACAAVCAFGGVA